MGQTTKGIKYPSDYSEVADVPEDLKKMAESIDELFIEHDTSIENLENKCKDFALMTETGNKIVLEIDNNTYKIKAVLKDKNNNVIDTSNEIDLPLEEMVTNVSYNNQSLVLTYKSGQTSNVSIADLINGLVNEEDFNALEEIVETNSKDIVDIAKENRELQSQISDLETLVETELESNEVEGTEIDVSDSAEYPGKIIPGANLEQEQLSGKNLLKNNGADSFSVYGVQYTKNKDKSIRINGTATAMGADYYIFGGANDTGEYLYFPQGTYSISEPSHDESWFYLARERTLGALFGNTAIKNALANQDCYFYGFFIRVTNGATLNNLILYPQIELGSEPTPYEPYCGGQPSPNPDYPQEIKVVTGDNVVKHVGKNLFDKDNPNKLDGGYIDISTNKISTSNKARCIYIPIKENRSYSVTKKITNYSHFRIATTQDIPTIGSTLFDVQTGDGNTTSLTLTSSLKSRYLVVWWGRVDYDNEDEVLSSLQIEEGSMPTPYEPYREEEYKLDLWKENEFDSENVEKLNAYFSDNEKIIASSNSAKTVVVSCKSNTTYRISKKQSSRFRVGYSSSKLDYSGILDYAKMCDSEKEVIIQTNSTAKYMYIYYYSSSSDTLTEQEILDSIQIQESIELCKIGDYEDELFKNEAGDENYNAELENGAWYKKDIIKKRILNGSETLRGTGINNIYYYAGITNYTRNNNIPLCSHFNGFDNVDSAAQIEGINRIGFNNTYDYNRLYISFDGTIEELAKLLAEKTPTLYYATDNPTYTKITNPTLISQLEALRKAKWFKGVNHWWTETDNLEPVLKGTYKQSNNLRLQALENILLNQSSVQSVNTIASTNISNQPVMLTTAELGNTTTNVSEESEAE